MSALVIASYVLLAGGVAPPASPAASAGTVSASAVTPTFYYNYSDFFNVPYGEWWDMRAPLYGDEPVGANCFNLTATQDGTCTRTGGGLNAYSKYPYMDWAGPAATAAMWAPYRLSVNGLYVPGYNLSSPVFLPLLNATAAPGNLLTFNWNTQYLDKAETARITSSPLSCYSATGYNSPDGYQLKNRIYLTMDNQEAARLFGAQSTGTQSALQSWWNNRILAPCNSATKGANAGAGPIEDTVNSWFQNVEGNGRYDIYNGYAAAYTSFYTNITARVLSGGPTGTTQLYIEHAAWGTEILLDRWFYWGNAWYVGNQSDSSKAKGWWGMENGWWEGVHYTGTLQATTMNFNLTGVLQYHFQEHSAPGLDNCLRGQTTCTEVTPSDDTPYWSWGPMLVDYVLPSSKGPYSELTRFNGLNYLKTTPGSGDYGTNTSFDYVPISWAAPAQQNWKFVFPTNTSAYYQNPATAVLGTDPLVNGQLPPISSSLSLRGIFPAGYGSWNAGTGTWSVTGGTAESWPASTGLGTYPYVPYPSISLQPPGIPPTVTTNATTAIHTTDATINGYLANKGSSGTVTVGFLAGTDPGLSGATNHSLGTHAVGTFNYLWGSLTPGTTYYYAAWAYGAGFQTGAIMSFTAGVYPPAVTTNLASGVTGTGATLNGNLDDLGSDTTVEVGFYWGTDSALVGAANVSAGTKTATGPFSSALASLTPGTTYYFRAWANGARFVNATAIQGFTTPAPPVVASAAATAILTSTATLNGDLTGLGTAVTVHVGFLWGTDAGLAGAANVTVGPFTLISTFSTDLVSLTPGTTYYYAAWANGDGFAQGATLNFKTAVTPPSVTTNAASSITTTGATLNGDLTNLGTAASVDVGFLYGTDPGLAGAANTTVGAETAATTFTHALTGLTPATRYYFQAWANGDGFVSGVIDSFAAGSTPPTVQTNAASGVTTTVATLNGATSALGTATTVTVGFLWGTDSGLAGATNLTSGPQTTAGAFTGALSGLAPGTTYYFRAWALGHGYVAGSTIPFATGVTPPSVTTNAASAVGTTAATLNGATTALGTASSVSVGFLWGTDAGLAGATNASAGSQTAAGAFTASLTGLTAGTTYYVRAWANGQGFAQGTILNFATTAAVSPPSVTTNAASGITASGATLNGNVGGLGSASSVTVGFVWGTDSGLAGATNVTVGPQTATGAFTTALTSLSAGTTYYFEAWTNGQGFAHGTIQSFTTQGGAAPPEPTFLGMPAMVGYAVLAAIIIVAVVAALVVLMMMRRRKKSPPESPPEPA